MPSYASPQDLVDRFGLSEIAGCNLDKNASRETMDEARVQLMLDQASSKIDSYLQRRYRLPLSAPYPISLVECCCKLARFDLTNGSRVQPSDQIVAGRKDSLQWLADIGTGKATLDIEEKRQTSQSWSRIASRSSTIGRGSFF